MSYASTSYVGCENIQDELNNLYQTCDHFTYREQIPFFEFLLSPFNRESLSLEVSPRGGRIRTVIATYFQRLLLGQVLENQTNPNCGNTTSRGECSTTYQMDVTENVQTGFTIKTSDLREVCKTNEQYLLKEIDRHVSGVVRKAAEKTADQFFALVGGWGDDTQGLNVAGNLEVRTRKTGATEDPYPFFAEEIQRATMVSNICDNPLVFGGQTLYGAFRQSSMAGCCQNSGIDVREAIEQFGFGMMYDKFVQAAFGGQEQNAVVSPGSLALATYTEADTAAGISDINLDAGVAGSLGVIFDPQTGLPIDIGWKVDCGQLQMNFTATTKLFGLPTDLYPVGDPLEGVTGTARVIVNNA